MDKKLLTCAAFFIVTQSSVLLSSAVFTGFSEDAVATFDKFTSNDYAARGKAVAGLTDFFNLLKNGTYQRNADQSAEYVDLSPFYEALSLATESFGITFNVSTLILDDCAEFESAVNESLHEVTGVIHELISAIASAYGGNYEENQSDIESDKNSAKSGFVNALKPLFGLLRSCINEQSSEYKSLIEEVEEKLDENVETIMNAIFEAIEAYGIITSECTEDEAAAAVASIETNQELTIATVIDNIERVFSLLETRYVNIYVETSIASHKVYALRITRKKITDAVDEIINLIFDVIAANLIECDAAEYDANSTDASKALANSKLQYAIDLFLDTVSSTLPDTADEVLVARLILPYVAPAILNNWFNGIGLAAAKILPLRLVLLAIVSVGKIQSLVSNFTVASAYKVYGNDSSTAVRLAELEEIVAIAVQSANDAVFAAIEVLARAFCATDCGTQADLYEIEFYRATAIYEINYAVHYLVGGNVRRVLVEAG